ncbi:hypothetical protein [uncultured Corynebacterium sp.]|uniref:hypothetical protein n=1 Tax=uncultured Corynebacterium sp. TaxID=159447 RepID=UPI0025E3922C|nr:hypothetical protein [uncultured Corynebacterium sp.]
MDTWTRASLQRRGFSRRSIDNQVRDSTLLRIARGHYLPGTATVADQLAALATLHPLGVFTGGAALAAYGLMEPRLPATIRVPRASRQRSDGFVRLVRSDEIEADELYGVRIAAPAQAVADALTFENLPERALRATLAQYYSGLRGRERFESDLAAVRSKNTSAVHDLARDAPVGAASGWERETHARLARAGLDPIPNFKLGAYFWDFGFRRGTTVLDLDSLRFHAPDDNHETFLLGLWKSNQAVQLGWAPLKVSDVCTGYHWRTVIRLVADTVRHRQARTGSRLAPAAVPGAILEPAWRFHEGISLSGSIPDTRMPVA